MALLNSCPVGYMKSQIREITVEDNSYMICEVERTHLNYVCTNCKQQTYFLQQLPFKSRGQTALFSLEPTTIHRYPLFLQEAHEAVPDSVQKYFFETEKCFEIGALNGAATCARLTVDEIGRFLEAKGGDLNERLNKLKEAGTLSEEIVSIAHDIRQLGRNGAHAEWTDVSQEQAESMMFMLREILRELYITPFERDKRRMTNLKSKKVSPTSQV
ncbi:MAG: DUF4145 domain-containing protein [Candidatus Obscuribacterales bacterium]|nr:DUF4145 domain-containing protein [Candidatus Obscuribacterales bacterium]